MDGPRIKLLHLSAAHLAEQAEDFKIQPNKCDHQAEGAAAVDRRNLNVKKTAKNSLRCLESKFKTGRSMAG